MCLCSFLYCLSNCRRCSCLTLLYYDQALGDGAGKYPLVISTWPFREAVRAAWRAIGNGADAVDAVVEGCSACEELRCDGTGEVITLKVSSR